MKTLIGAPHPSCWEPTYTVDFRSTCIPSIHSFADTGLLAEKCTCLQIGVCFLLTSGDTGSPSRSLGFLVLQRKVNPDSQPGGTSTAFLTLHEHLVIDTSSCWDICDHKHWSHCWPLLVDILQNKLKFSLGLNSTCYFSSESRLTAKGQDSRDAAGTSPLLPGSFKARIYQMKQHEHDLIGGWASPRPLPTVALVRSPQAPVRKCTDHPQKQDLFFLDARLVETMILEFSPYLMSVPDW